MEITNIDVREVRDSIAPVAIMSTPGQWRVRTANDNRHLVLTVYGTTSGQGETGTLQWRLTMRDNAAYRERGADEKTQGLPVEVRLPDEHLQQPGVYVIRVLLDGVPKGTREFRLTENDRGDYLGDG